MGAQVGPSSAASRLLTPYCCKTHSFSRNAVSPWRKPILRAQAGSQTTQGWIQDLLKMILTSVFFRLRVRLRFGLVLGRILGAMLGPPWDARPTELDLVGLKTINMDPCRPETAQEAAKTPQEAAKTAQDAPQDPPRAPKHLPRPPQTTQNNPEMASESLCVLLSSLLLPLSFSLSFSSLLSSSRSLPEGGGELTYRSPLAPPAAS